jgi:hypothetical protein
VSLLSRTCESEPSCQGCLTLVSAGVDVPGVCRDTSLKGRPVRKIAAVACLVLSVCAALVPAASAAPTITFEEYCPVNDGRQFYGALATVSGLPPNTPFMGTLQLDDRIFGPASLVTNELGTYGPIGLAEETPVAVVTATVTWDGGTLVETFVRPCQGPRLPTSKDQCKNGGWRTYGVFKNQGDCVSFVATGGKNPPGES